MAEESNNCQQGNTRFLHGYLEKLRRWHADWFDLLPCDLFEPSEEARLEYEREAERVARLADDTGMSGSLFRDFLREDPNEDSLSTRRHRCVAKKIETVARIIAKLEASGTSSETIPPEAKLLSVSQLAKMLGLGESTLRGKNRKGLVPEPIKLDGLLKWNKGEIDSWIKHRCPNRAEWERNRDKWMEEVKKWHGLGKPTE